MKLEAITLNDCMRRTTIKHTHSFCLLCIPGVSFHSYFLSVTVLLSNGPMLREMAADRLKPPCHR